MTTTPIPVDVEALLVGYLNAQLAEPVMTMLPTNPTYPLVMLRRIGGIGREPRWLDRATVQVDAWGSTKQEARLSAATAWAKLNDMEGAFVYGAVSGVVSGVRSVTGLTWLPDENDQPRYTFTVSVSVHP